MRQVVEKESVEDVVEKVGMVFARARTVGHEVDLANHGLDRRRLGRSPVQHQIDGVHGARLIISPDTLVQTSMPT